jgi:hypothetical protein
MCEKETRLVKKNDETHKAESLVDRRSDRERRREKKRKNTTPTHFTHTDCAFQFVQGESCAKTRPINTAEIKAITTNLFMLVSRQKKTQMILQQKMIFVILVLFYLQFEKILINY